MLRMLRKIILLIFIVCLIHTSICAQIYNPVYVRTETPDKILALTNVPKEIYKDGELEKMVITMQIPYIVCAKPANETWRQDRYLRLPSDTTSDQAEEYLIKAKTIELALSYAFPNKQVIALAYYPTLNAFTIWFCFMPPCSVNIEQYEKDKEILNQYITKIR